MTACPCGAPPVKGDTGHTDDCPYPCYSRCAMQVAHWTRERERRRNFRTAEVDTQPVVEYIPPNPSPEKTPVARKRELNRCGQTCLECGKVLIANVDQTALVCPSGHGRIVQPQQSKVRQQSLFDAVDGGGLGDLMTREDTAADLFGTDDLPGESRYAGELFDERSDCPGF